MTKPGKDEVGREGEKLAADFLKKKGYKILRKNYTCNLGEIDIIASDKNVLAFVEVKARSSNRFGPPELAVTRQKRRQIVRVAETFLSQSKIIDVDCRFDVVAISFNRNDNNSPEIRLLQDAFRSDDI